MKEVNYVQFLSEEDKLRVVFQKRRGKIEHFVLHYYALVDGRWRSIMRYDTCYGYVHKHTFYFRKGQYIMKLTEKGENFNQVYTEASNNLRKNFLRIKQNFKQA